MNTSFPRHLSLSAVALAALVFASQSTAAIASDDHRAHKFSIDELKLLLRADLPQSLRRAAIERLGSLPANEALPVLMQEIVDHQDAFSKHDKIRRSRGWFSLRAALITLNKMSSKDFDDFVIRALSEGPKQRREYVTRLLIGYRSGSREVAKALAKEAKSHDKHDILEIIDALVMTRDSIAVPVLSKIFNDAEYSDAARWQARYGLSTQFAPKAIDIRLKLVQSLELDPDCRPRRSAVVAITLRNLTDKDISFSYSEASEIFAPILAQESITKRSPVPKHHPFTSSPANSDEIRVTILPNRTWTVRFNVDSAFPLDDVPFGKPAFGVFVRIPGVHDVPQVSRYGIKLVVPKRKATRRDDLFG